MPPEQKPKITRIKRPGRAEKTAVGSNDYKVPEALAESKKRAATKNKTEQKNSWLTRTLGDTSKRKAAVTDKTTENAEAPALPHTAPVGPGVKMAVSASPAPVEKADTEAAPVRIPEERIPAEKDADDETRAPWKGENPRDALAAVKKMYLDALEKNPSDERMKRDAAAVCALLGESGEAKRILDAGAGKDKKSVEDRLGEIRIKFQSGESAEAVKMLGALADELRAKAPLALENLAFCSRIEAFGRYTERAQGAFRPGEYFLLYFEVKNFAQKKSGPKAYSAHLTVSYKILDSSGTVRYERREGGDVKYATKSALTDLNMSLSGRVPANLPAGSYELHVYVTDHLKAYNKNTAAKTALAVK